MPHTCLADIDERAGDNTHTHHTHTYTYTTHTHTQTHTHTHSHTHQATHLSSPSQMKEWVINAK